MRAKDIETERLWDEMKRKNPSLYDSEHPAPLIEPHAKKREARKVYSDSVDDYPPEDDFDELDTAKSDSSTSVHTDEMDYSEEEEWYENGIAEAFMEDDFKFYWDWNGHRDNDYVDNVTPRLDPGFAAMYN